MAGRRGRVSTYSGADAPADPGDEIQGTTRDMHFCERLEERHPRDALIEIFPIIDEVRNDPDDTGRQYIGTCS